MKVKILIDCIGVGYEFKKGQVTDVNKKIGDKLIKVKFAEEIKPPKRKETRAKS